MVGNVFDDIVSSGVLCAFGDATTQLRNETSATFIRSLTDATSAEVISLLQELLEKFV